VNALGDTWLWDGANWAQATTTVAAEGRWFGAMGTDRNGNVILFGGAHYCWNNLVSPETWKWDGTSWSDVSGATMATEAPDIRCTPSCGRKER
jgi:hypothetical protein